MHSLAVLNISDHYVRLKVNGGGCVLGGLMGTSGEGCVEVRASFELPVENGAVDAAFVGERARQCKQVFPAHDMVGLYTVAPVSEALRAQIVRLIRGSGRVLLVLNPEDAKSSSVFPVSTYAMDTSGAAFERQPLRVVSDEPERIGIEHVAHHSSESQKSSQCKITQVTFHIRIPFLVLTHLTGLGGSLEILHQKVLEVSRRAEQMATGEIPYNCDFVRKAYFLSRMLPAPSSPSFRQRLSDVKLFIILNSNSNSYSILYSF